MATNKAARNASILKKYGSLENYEALRVARLRETALKKCKTEEERLIKLRKFARKDRNKASLNPEKIGQEISCSRCGASFIAGASQHLYCRKCALAVARIENSGTLEDYYKKASDKGSLTKQARYGDPHYNNRNQSEKTCLEKYGVRHQNQSEGLKVKIATTKLERYGDPAYNNREKFKNTLERKYGAGITSTAQLDEVKQKAKQTKLERYGDVRFNNRIKCAETNLSRFGYSAPAMNPTIHAKMTATLFKHFGVTSPIQNFGIKKKIEQTCLKKYGYPNTGAVPSITSKRLSHKEKSKPEKKMIEFLNNRGFSYLSNYSLNGKCFDFAIFSGELLKILIEIDGEFYHGLLSDADGKHVRENTDYARFLKVPEGVKFIVCDSQKVEQSFPEILRVFDLDYSSWISEIIEALPVEFPFPSYSDKRLRQDYLKLLTYPFRKHQNLGLSLIRQFHRSLWSSRVRGLPSPKEAWSDPVLLRKCVENRFIYSSSLSSQAIVNGFSACKLAPKVSVFSPSIAKYLVEKYLQPYNVIFDPFSGFSGRLLGVTAANKSYIGQDINPDIIAESEKLRDFLNIKGASLRVQDVLSDTQKTYEALFTCSPYGKKESWGVSSGTYSCDEWIDICLQKYSCDKYLFVVDNTSKYASYVVEELPNTSHFGNNKEKVIVL